MDMLKSIANSTQGITANVDGGGSISGLLFMILNLIVGILWGSCFIAFAYGFYLYTMSKGDPKSVSQAWNVMIYGIFALGISMIVILAKDLAPRILGVDQATQKSYESSF